MTKKIIFQDSFLVSGIMCYQGCGNIIKNVLSDLAEFKQQHLLPEDAQLIIDAEPQDLGIHRLFIMIESEEQLFNQDESYRNLLSVKFKEILDSIGYEVIDNNKNTKKNKSNSVNWINILVNLASMFGIIILSAIFPPSLLLTIGLTTLSFLTTAFTARSYLINFFRNLRNKNPANMATPITLGWLLSLAHTLYHSITMPLASSFSMIFMSFIMPVMLIMIINGMDEIKRLVLNKSKKMHLKGMKALFPSMAKEYHCYPLSQQEQEELSQLIKMLHKDNSQSDYFVQSISNILINEKIVRYSKNTLKKEMIIKIKRGECFPVDGLIIQGNTLVDASILTGEPQQPKQLLDFVPAGAINLGQDVSIYATQDCYNSAVNALLFRSNRAREEKIASESNRKFAYLYVALIMVGITASILTPLALGMLTILLVLQNVTGILFAVCPCTIAIAHQLPKLLSLYRRNQKGITMRNENLTGQFDEIHTIVFDKTGTLTTGNSQVDMSEGISFSLWQRIYLLEKHHGAEHPLAKAINNYCETIGAHQSIIKEIKDVSVDSKNRGLSAVVQGKQIHLGNLDYLQHLGVVLPNDFPLAVKNKLAQGYTPVYVAEDGVYQGLILIRHEIRKDILPALARLKKEGKKLIMLTGDSKLSTMGFNQQYGAIFEPDNIHAEQTPLDKEIFLNKLMDSQAVNSKGVWFVGDGLNDAPCARILTEKGGVSCAMTSNDKAAFFTDISLNGSLDYLFEHAKLNRFLQKNIIQNQWLLAYGSITFLAFIISFSIAGIAISPLIPLGIMVSTTLFSLFNSYRVQLSVDNALDKNTSWYKQYLASDLSTGLLIGASTLLICSLLISTLATGGLVLPAIIFTAGAVAAVSSVCILAASVMFGAFALLCITYLFAENCVNHHVEDTIDLVPAGNAERPHSPVEPPETREMNYPTLNFGLHKAVRKRVDKPLFTPDTFADNMTTSVMQ